MDNHKQITTAHKVTNLKRKNGDFKKLKCAVAGCVRKAKIQHHPDYNESNYTIPSCSAAHHHILSKSFR